LRAAVDGESLVWNQAFYFHEKYNVPFPHLFRFYKWPPVSASLSEFAVPNRYKVPSIGLTGSASFLKHFDDYGENYHG
jgi:hypothetical protein